MGGSGPFGEGSGGDTPLAVENFRMLKDAPDQRQPRRPGREGVAGEPAELGRQGLAAGAVPGRRKPSNT